MTWSMAVTFQQGTIFQYLASAVLATESSAQGIR